ncbi:MAG TPA: low molecular weight protein-tyrosine-phosphatase [Candidatus Krumholzibacteria bacterium]|nr:low molecular weight protein-tyrosine-phosphatase [Candidatus Krumholzibacteria bacterium]
MTQRVLFVCLGNICRSPLAEGVFRHLVTERGLDDRIEVDSAGTGGWHVGEGPDPRSLEVAVRNGVSLDGQSARRIENGDLADFHWVVAMDTDNERDLRRLAEASGEARIHRLRDFDPEGAGDVPDPYYGGPQGFDVVYAMVERSCRALLDRVEAELGR